MYGVDLYLRVRLACHVDGLSQREAASRFGIARETVKKILRQHDQTTEYTLTALPNCPTKWDHLNIGRRLPPLERFLLNRNPWGIPFSG